LFEENSVKELDKCVDCGEVDERLTLTFSNGSISICGDCMLRRVEVVGKIKEIFKTYSENVIKWKLDDGWIRCNIEDLMIDFDLI
jgi:hypothetical protein